MKASLTPLLVAALLGAPPLGAQVTFEIEGGGGYTLVDVEAVAEDDGEIADDWVQANYRISVRAFLSEVGGFPFAVEGGYQYAYWYQVRVPFGPTPIIRAYDVDAPFALAMLRLGDTAALVDVGAGVALFDSPAAVVSVAVGSQITDRLAIKLRADGLVLNQPTLPIGLAVSYAFGGS